MIRHEVAAVNDEAPRLELALDDFQRVCRGDEVEREGRCSSELAFVGAVAFELEFLDAFVGDDVCATETGRLNHVEQGCDGTILKVGKS